MWHGLVKRGHASMVQEGNPLQKKRKYNLPSTLNNYDQNRRRFIQTNEKPSKAITQSMQDCKAGFYSNGSTSKGCASTYTRRTKQRRDNIMSITKERAKELRWLCKVWPGERCKNIKPESEQERKRVKEIWDKNPSGFSSYYSTLCDIEQGRVEG